MSQSVEVICPRSRLFGHVEDDNLVTIDGKVGDGVLLLALRQTAYDNLSARRR